MLETPHANAEVERMIKTIKRLIKMSIDPYLTSLDYRDIPETLEKSTADILMGRRLHTTIPLNPGKSVLKVANQKDVRRNNRVAREKAKRNFDRRHTAKGLPQLR